MPPKIDRKEAEPTFRAYLVTEYGCDGIYPVTCLHAEEGWQREGGDFISFASLGSLELDRNEAIRLAKIGAPMCPQHHTPMEPEVSLLEEPDDSFYPAFSEN